MSIRHNMILDTYSCYLALYNPSRIRWQLLQRMSNSTTAADLVVLDQMLFTKPVIKAIPFQQPFKHAANSVDFHFLRSTR